MRWICLALWGSVLLSTLRAAIQPGDKIQVEGALQLYKGSPYLVTAEGHAFKLIGDLHTPVEERVRMARFEGYYVRTAKRAQGEHGLILSSNPKGLQKALELSSAEAEPVSGSVAFHIDSHFKPQEFDPQIRSAATSFLKVYLPYVRELERRIVLRYAQRLKQRHQEYSRLQEPPEHLFSSVEEPPDLRRIRQSVFEDFHRRFVRWNIAYKDLRERFLKNLKEGLRPAELYFHFSRRDYLIYIVDKKGGRVLCAIPAAYGYNPDGGHKQRSGDGRTPLNPTGTTSPKRTPYFIGRRIQGTCKPGMSGACLGVTSRREEDQFWVQYGMNIAIHGSSRIFSLGTRSSNGCLRVYNQDAGLLYELSMEGTPVVLE